jgi:hypothetical protein
MKLINIADPRLKSIKGIAQKWLHANEKFIKAEEGTDTPWTYNERAMISILAGAAWLAGGTALEEYGTRKLSHRKAGRICDKSGRIDLYITTPKRFRQKALGFACEAKFCEVNIYGRSQIDGITTSWNHAVKDAGKLAKDEGNHRLAISFVSLHAACEKQESHTATINQIRSLYDDIQRVIKPGLICAYLAKENELTYEKKNKYTYPGTLMLIKYISRSKC